VVRFKATLHRSQKRRTGIGYLSTVDVHVQWWFYCGW